jgi:predicted 3-demethylubiquinone-9 3-methyltransferase (glyoxalase superfamily)
MQKITPCLWYDTQAEEAARFYVSVFRDGSILDIMRHTEPGPGEPGSVFTVEFEIAGRHYLALNGGPMFKFNESVSLIIDCEDQQEVDYYWDRLREGGGSEQACGWLKDRFGLSWQVVPRRMVELLKDADREKAGRVMAAMMEMVKIDMAELERAARG